MLIHWGDAWVGTTKGWFNVYFYPQDSSTGSQSSGYLYSSFKKTGKLWWGPFQGGEGAVYASIDGAGSSYPIAECDNASRVIKYVVILGYRYYSYSLVSMRIHDIAVVADLTRKNPTAPNPEEPVVYDGTEKGLIAEEDQSSVDYDLGVLLAQLNIFWTGPWPVLHIVRDPQPLPEQPNTDDGIPFHVTKDLTQRKFTIQSFSSPVSEYQPLGIDMKEVIEWLILDIGVGILAGATAAAWNSCEKAALAGWAGVIYPIALGLTTALIVLPYLAVKNMVDSGQWTADWGTSALFAIAITILSIVWFAPLLGAMGQAIFDSLASIATPGLIAAAINAMLSPTATIVLTLVGIFYLVVAVDAYFSGRIC